MSEGQQSRGADALVAALQALGVRTIFSLSGNQIMPVYDACLTAGVRIIHTRHEAAAVFMADAWSQLTGELGVAMVTAGPGLGNAMGALYAARMNDSPVLLLAGDSPLAQDGQGAFQMLDQCAMCAPVVKRTMRSAGADCLVEEVMALAGIALSGRHGPVHLALPADGLDCRLNQPVSRAALHERARVCRANDSPASPELCKRWLTMLRTAKRPLVLTGPMLSRSRIGDRVAELSAACQAPVLCIDSSRGLRDPAQANLAACVAASDCLLLIGRQADFATGFAARQQAASRTILVADAVPLVATNATESVEVSPMAMALALIVQAAADAASGVPPSRSREADAWSARVLATLSARPESTFGDAAFTGALDALQARLDTLADPVLIIDGGEFGQWAQARLSAKTRIVNGLSGAIGGGPPMAVAAALARPDSTIVLLMGDGSAGFHLLEFETAVRVGARFIAIIGNDHQWHAESLIQARSYGPDRRFACELSQQTRYDLAATALGGSGEQVDDDRQLMPAFERALVRDGVTCIDWRISPQPAPEYPRAELI